MTDNATTAGTDPKPINKADVERLLPCPFCAATSHHIGLTELEGDENPSLRKSSVICAECIAEGPPKDARHDALAAWNRRATLPARQPAAITAQDVLNALDRALIRSQWGFSMTAIKQIASDLNNRAGAGQGGDGEVERLKAALEWYERHVTNCRKMTGEGEVSRNALDNDGGNRARAALAPAEPQS